MCAKYLPSLVSCCRRFFMKWTLLLLFGRGKLDELNLNRKNVYLDITFLTAYKILACGLTVSIQNMMKVFYVC